MADFTKEEYEHLMQMRAIAIDDVGRETLVGLTEAETLFYLSFSRILGGDNICSEQSAYYLELSERHERARLAVLGAEVELRALTPTRH